MNMGPRKEDPKSGATQMGLTTPQLAPGSRRALAELRLEAGAEGEAGSPALNLWLGNLFPSLPWCPI